MLYIIDGTGELSDDVYEKDMRGGFCDRLRREYGGIYHRGPTDAGFETYFIADGVYDAILASPFLQTRMLFLAGHSRGGAAVIHVAQRLKKKAISVDGLFLFDAVDRTISAKNVQLIPRNVKITYHARRETSISTYFSGAVRDAQEKFNQCRIMHPAEDQFGGSPCVDEWESLSKYKQLDDAMRLRMRSKNSSFDFGNCGLGVEAPCNADEARSRCEYKEAKFLGSHGAMGGSAIGEQDNTWSAEAERNRFEIIRNNDRAAMNSVWAWMRQNFSESYLDLHQSMTSHPTPERPWQAPFP